MTIPLPDECPERMQEVVTRVLGQNKTFAATAVELTLTVGQVSRQMMNYWYWRQTGELKSYQPQKANHQPAKLERDKPPRIGGNVPSLGRVHSSDVVVHDHSMAKKGRPSTFPSTRKKVYKSAEDICPPTDEEIYLSYARQIIEASREIKPRERTKYG